MLLVELSSLVNLFYVKKMQNSVKAQNSTRAKSSKAQTGVETFIVVLLLVLISIYSFTTYLDRNREIKWSDRAMDAQRECYRTAFLINRVRANGYGFSEQTIFNKYNVRISGNSNGIDVLFYSDPASGQQYYYCSFQTSNVTNSTHYNFEIYGKYDVVNEGKNITFHKI